MEKDGGFYEVAYYVYEHNVISVMMYRYGEYKEYDTSARRELVSVHRYERITKNG